MMKLVLSLVLFLIYSGDVIACPACAGSMDNPGDQNVVYILMIFIGLTYIPFYLLYKTIWKHRHLNKIDSK